MEDVLSFNQSLPTENSSVVLPWLLTENMYADYNNVQTANVSVSNIRASVTRDSNFAGNINTDVIICIYSK